MATAKRQRIIKVSAAEKAARAGLLRSAQLGLQAMAGRVGAATKGAFANRQLRHAGDTLDRYNMGNYSDTLGGFYPTPPTGAPGGGTSPRRKAAPKKGTGHSRTTTNTGKNKDAGRRRVPPQTPQRQKPKPKPGETRKGKGGVVYS